MPGLSPNVTPARAAELRAQGAALLAAREDNGFTQAQAAAFLGVPTWTYRSWEYAVRPCPPDAAYRVVVEWGGSREHLPYGGTCPSCREPWPEPPLPRPEPLDPNRVEQGRAILAARRSTGLSQREAAQQLKIPRPTLRDWESGESVCPPAARRVIVRLLGADLPYGPACPCCGRPWS